MTVKVKQTNPGWLDRLRKRYKSQDVVAVGFPQSEAGSVRYPDGTELLDVAAWNNFGTSRIPRRDFMTPGGQNAIEKTAPIARAGVKRINEGRETPEDVLRKMGPVAQAQFQLAIREIKEPPNSPVTVALKGSANPLVNTGLLQQSVSHVVRLK